MNLTFGGTGEKYRTNSQPDFLIVYRAKPRLLKIPEHRGTNATQTLISFITEAYEEHFRKEEDEK